MQFDWASFLASFLGASVEAVEALTIILAVGTTRGWRASLSGAGLAFIILALMVVFFGAALSHVPIHILQLVVGILLLLFGLRWLRKAILRSAGFIALRDETALYEKQLMELKAKGLEPGIDWLGFVTTFKATLLEGLEVVFIVIAVGTAGGHTVSASLGAGGACVLVGLLGLIVHRPLAHVPENGLKFAVGVLLTAFGTYWTGEGLGLTWPFGDLAILAQILLIIATSLTLVYSAPRLVPHGDSL